MAPATEPYLDVITVTSARYPGGGESGGGGDGDGGGGGGASARVHVEASESSAAATSDDGGVVLPQLAGPSRTVNFEGMFYHDGSTRRTLRSSIQQRLRYVGVTTDPQIRCGGAAPPRL
jgi:hypothetical protein